MTARYTLAEAAERLGITKDGARKACRRLKIYMVWADGHWTITEDQIETLANRRGRGRPIEDGILEPTATLRAYWREKKSIKRP